VAGVLSVLTKLQNCVFLAAELVDGKIVVTVPNDEYCHAILANADKFGGASVEQVVVAQPHSMEQYPPPPPAAEAEAAAPVQPVPAPPKDNTELIPKLWPNEIFSDLKRFKSVADVDMHTAAKAWDPAVWFMNYQWFEKQAQSTQFPGKQLYRDEKLCGLRVLVAHSIGRFLSEDPLDQTAGWIEQIYRKYSAQGFDLTLTGIEQIIQIRAPNPRVGRTVWTDTITPPPARPRFQATEVRIVNMDCIDAVYGLQTKWPQAKIACLNMANQFHPGGGW
jgi:hypothetical protein